MKKITILLFTFTLTLNISSIFSQEKKISITVKDYKNKPVAGAVILFDNVRQKRWTNTKGKYKVKIVEEPKIITAFSPKIGIQKIKYDGKENVIIIIPKGKNNLTITNPKNKELDPNQFWSIYEYLRGNVPGVNVSPSNVITIRGYGTVNGNMTPLFILNGSNISKEAFSRIRPNLIKSISVLKGPETAYYGIRGANGVIVVQTL